MCQHVLNRFMLLGFVVMSGLALTACSGDGSVNGEQPSELTTVVGQVTEIDDQVPVDGGVTIKVRLDNGSNRTLYFESMFTEPPPSVERVALYEKVRLIKVGDRVRASGVETDEHISLRDIQVVVKRD